MFSKGRVKRNFLGRHMDSLRNKGGKRGGGKQFGKERKKERGKGDENERKRLIATANSLLYA